MLVFFKERSYGSHVSEYTFVEQLNNVVVSFVNGARDKPKDSSTVFSTFLNGFQKQSKLEMANGVDWAY